MPFSPNYPVADAAAPSLCLLHQFSELQLDGHPTTPSAHSNR